MGMQAGLGWKELHIPFWGAIGIDDDRGSQADDRLNGARFRQGRQAGFYSPASRADLRRKSAESAADYLYEDRLRNWVNGLDRPEAKRR